MELFFTRRTTSAAPSDTATEKTRSAAEIKARRAVRITPVTVVSYSVFSGFAIACHLSRPLSHS